MFSIFIALLVYYLCWSCHGIEIANVNRRQGPGAYYIITGPVGGVHPRLEIRELQQNPIMWNLFLLAMREFQAMDQNEIDSYYQIAGNVLLPSNVLWLTLFCVRHPWYALVSAIVHEVVAHTHSHLEQERLGWCNLQHLRWPSATDRLLPAP